MANTTNLDLELYEKGVDPDIGFEQYRLELDGSTDSNMTKIDDFFAQNIVTFLPLLNTSMSGSFSFYSGSLVAVAGSITSASSTLDSYATRFYKIASHSGSGQADFTNIPKTFTHLLIMGGASVADNTDGSANIGIDFNGITTTGCYATVQWGRSGSIFSSPETFKIEYTGQIIIGKVPAALTEVTHLSPFFAIVPFYSGSSSASGTYLYKSVMGFSAYSMLTLFSSTAIQGGNFLSSGCVNRIRVFGSHLSSTRIDLNDNSYVSLYGIY